METSFKNLTMTSNQTLLFKRFETEGNSETHDFVQADKREASRSRDLDGQLAAHQATLEEFRNRLRAHEQTRLEPDEKDEGLDEKQAVAMAKISRYRFVLVTTYSNLCNNSPSV